MTVEMVLQVVDQIIPLLASYGHPDKAEWLSKESALLRDSNVSSSQVRAALHTLHSIVPGMGGLMDLGLAGSSREDEIQARKTLDTLGNELYELTR
jgi:hypothetical protein